MDRTAVSRQGQNCPWNAIDPLLQGVDICQARACMIHKIVSIQGDTKFWARAGMLGSVLACTMVLGL